MNRCMHNRNGSAMVLALLFVTFFMMVAAGVVPFAIAQVKHASLNVDVVEAQYAAEAGAKRAVVGIMQGNTSWAWANNQAHNAVADGTDATKYYYINSITNSTNSDTSIADNTKPSTTAVYTITSTGYVNGVKRTVKATVTPGGDGGGVFQSTAFSKSTLTMQSGTITGDIAATTVALQYGTKIIGDVTYQSPSSSINGKIDGTIQQTSTIGTLDVASMMSYVPTMPSISISASSTKKLLPEKNATLKGSYNYNTNPNSGVYYSNSTFANWNYAYTVEPDQSILMYVAGDYTIGQPITGGGNITIYATGTVNIAGNITGNNVNIYAGNDIIIKNDAAIITANNVTLQSNRNFEITNKSITASNCVNIYCGNIVNTGGGTIDAPLVTIIANGINSNTPGYLHGTAINLNQPNNVTKIYVNGNVTIEKLMSGGASMLISTGEVLIRDLTGSTIVVAEKDITVHSANAGGLYSNGEIYIYGATLNYPSSATISKLGITSGTVTYTVKWSN